MSPVLLRFGKIAQNIVMQDQCWIPENLMLCEIRDFRAHLNTDLSLAFFAFQSQNLHKLGDHGLISIFIRFFGSGTRHGTGHTNISSDILV